MLVLTETRGYHHVSIPTALATVKRLGGGLGLDVVPLAGAGQLTGARLRGAAAVVFLLTSGDLPLPAAGKAALLSFVRRGGGLAGFHSAGDTFHHWGAYIAMLGAEFSHHALPSVRRVIVEDARNPATAALGRAFSLKEEFYVFKGDPRRSSHVLARLDTGPGGPDRPLVWCRRYGRGRVFYDALGHFPQTWGDPRMLALVRGGLRWAAGRVAASGC